MTRLNRFALLLVLCIAASAGSLRAQTEKTVTLRMLDSRSGDLIATSDFLIRIDRQETVHADWVSQNGDGTGKLTLPDGASVLAVQAKYDRTMQVYVNCDTAKDKPSPIDRWYSVADILKSGIAAPNGCSKRTAAAKPGEFVFYVRRANWHEQMNSDSRW